LYISKKLCINIQQHILFDLAVHEKRRAGSFTVQLMSILLYDKWRYFNYVF